MSKTPRRSQGVRSRDRRSRHPVRSIAAALVLPWLIAGCSNWGPRPPSVQDRLSSRPDNRAAAADDRSPRQGATPSAARRPIATVNGANVDRREFMEQLTRSHGLGLLQRWIQRDLARAEARRLGISTNRGHIEAEYDRTIRSGLDAAASTPVWTPHQREKFIEELIRLRGWSRFGLDLVMERQACLRAVAETRVTVPDAMLRDEFARRHGARVEVRHIQLSALRFWPPLKRRLDQGEAFSELAAHYSQNPASRRNGGLLPPFAEDDPDMPGALRKAAFALTPGQVSKPIQYEGKYHVLQLECRIPPDDVPFDQVAAALRSSLRDRLVERKMTELSASLLRQCKLRIHDRILGPEYKRARATGTIEGPVQSGP